MILEFQGNHKSLHSFVSEELNDFTVIVGKNGSGKTQLIEIIKERSSPHRYTNPHSKFQIIPAFETIQFEGLENSGGFHTSVSNWTFTISFVIDRYRNLGQYFARILDLSKEYSVPIERGFLKKLFTRVIYQTEKEEQKEFGIWMQKAIFAFLGSNAVDGNSIEQMCEQYDQHLENWFFDIYLPVISFVAEYRQKPFADLKEYDFHKTPIPERLFDPRSLFSSTLAGSFYHYAKMRDLNSRDFFEKQSFGKVNGAIHPNEFDTKWPAPWTLINQVFSDIGIGFHFSGVKVEDFVPELPVLFSLHKWQSDRPIEFSDLSSGEKVIIGIILKMFATSFYDEKIEYPELLVLDEPDAHLHPEMSKMLIDVLCGTFVKKLGMKVIMTTHSPSTVALCPDDSIYELRNEPETSLRQIEKSAALKLLTGFLPTLSIDYKNHKQVFVESPTDVFYYQTVFDKLNEEMRFPFRLYFISNAMGKGNSSQVRKIVADLRSSGNVTSFGIIDWDLKNCSADFVFVHGEGRRYSIENYVFDPILICVLLLQRKDSRCAKGLGLDVTFNEHSVGSQNSEFLQKWVDWFFEQIKPRHGWDMSDLEDIEYKNSTKLSVPKAYLSDRGHDFESRLKEAFPTLIAFKSEGELQRELTVQMAKCYPLIPKDSVELIKQIVSRG